MMVEDERGSGAYVALGRCQVCGRTITFNPHIVPSIKVDAEGHPSEDGTREPLCPECAEKVNDLYEERGLGRPLNVREEAYGPVEGLPE